MALVFSISSCKNWSNTAKGGAIGAGVGGTVGGAVGKRSGNTVTGAILGAAIGGVAGAAIGRYMDKQKKELEEDLGDIAEVERVGEGIHIRFDSGLLFDFNSSALSSASKANIQKMASTLNEYPDTNILVEGHTDSKGSEEYNQNLSVERASSVVDYALAQGIPRSRMTIKGYGESQPIATNETEAGRQQNRRVEIAIYANEELKQKARNGNL